MARLIRSNGKEEIVTPQKDKRWTLVELQAHIGGFIELMPGIRPIRMIMDEEGRLKMKPLNQKATVIVRKALLDKPLRYDPIIVGDVLILDEEEKM